MDETPLPPWFSALMALSLLAQSGAVVYYAESYDRAEWEAIAGRQGVAFSHTDVLIAHRDCSTLGSVGLLWIEGDPIPYRVRVVDCTHAQDMASVESRGIVAEVPYRIAARFSIDGVGEGKLLLEDGRGLVTGALLWGVPLQNARRPVWWDGKPLYQDVKEHAISR